MPQAQANSQVWFGNAALPNGQGTMAWLNLNDRINWFLQDLTPDDTNAQLQVVQFPYRSKGAFVAVDRAGQSLILPMRYSEVNTPLGGAKSQLSMAGEQFISLDNKATVALCRYKAMSSRTLARRFPPQLWDFNLEFFLGKEPFFQDISATIPSGFPIAQGGSISPGTTVTTAIVYAGTVPVGPVYTLNVPVGNTVVINSLKLANQMSGETLTITFAPALTASTVWTITIDCGAFTVTDQNNAFYDFTGSFPQLYGPAGQSQNLASTLITASGTSTGVTLGCSFANRWEI